VVSGVDPNSWRRRLPLTLAALVPIALMAWTVRLVAPNCLSGDDERTLLTIWSPRVWVNAVYTAGGLLVVLAALCVVPFRGRPYFSAVAASGCVCFLLWGMLGMVHLRHPWMADDPPVIGPDGAAYREGGDGDGDVWLLRDVDRRWDRDVAEVLANRWSTRDLHLIRPAGVASVIRFDADGRVFLVSFDRQTVGFDPRSPPPPAPRSEWREWAYARRLLATADVSPFVLLGPSERGDDEDVNAILETIDHAAPPEKHLLAALDSANPWVAETAARLVRAGGETLYPEATRRLAR
jgi:hypothetical protein